MTKRESKFAAIEASLQPNPSACLTCAWLRDAPEEDAEYITALLASPVKVKGHKHISNVLAGDGVNISEDAIRNHRVHRHNPL